ncbi:hypothetical protein LguiB_022998 [Lonicera macranthoides]
MVTTGDKMGKDIFKAGYLNKLEGKLLVSLPGTEIRGHPHISSKLKVWKKNYHTVKEMRNTSGFGWNDEAKMIEVESDTVWEDYCKGESNAKGLRFKAFPYYDDWCMIFGNDRATGDMAESAADAADAMGAYDVDTDGLNDGSSVSRNNNSPHESKKKPKISDVLMSGLSNFGDKIVSSFEMSASKLEMLGSRMGYQHDLSAKRSVVNEALKKLPITTEQRVKASMAITQEAQKVDYFFSLTSDKEKMIMVQNLCP